MSKMMYCHECGDAIEELDTAYQLRNGEYICEHCRDAYYFHCDDCYSLVHERCIIAVDDGDRYICENCAAEYYTCDYCENMFSEFNIAVNTYSLTLCDRCYNNYYFTCDGCGEVYHIDDAEYVNDTYYCQYCADDYRGRMYSYTYKPNPRFYGGHAGYGVELEIDDGDNKRDAVRDIQAAAGKHIYIKEDASLSQVGMEIVTHPATLDYHINEFPWRDICHVALSYGYRSHDTDTCGLHIHASRSLFGSNELEQDLTIAKIMLLIDRWYDTYILRFARRDLSNMKRWADKPNAGIRPEDNDVDAVQKSKNTATDRYKAVNLCNSNTVEFRFFKGTLKRDTIIASIQWVDTIINYCKTTSLKNLFSATWDEIFGNTGHAELTAYLKQCKLYNLKERM